jgi:hypothetical protein
VNQTFFCILILQVWGLFCNQLGRPPLPSHVISYNMLKSSSLRDCDQEEPLEKYEKRRIQRISLSLTARVDVRVDRTLSWNETVRVKDVSMFGAGFTLQRPIKRGRLLLMTMPLPRDLRCFDRAEPLYKIWANVRRCIKSTTGEEYSVGVAFIGKSPPATALENPSQLYDIAHADQAPGEFWRLIPADLMSKASHRSKDDRKHTRYAIPETLVIQRLDASGKAMDPEFSVTENISLGGACVLTTLSAEAGTFVRVTSDRLGVAILCIVRRMRVGEDGVTRLHLEFVDRHFPLEGIEHPAIRN